MSKLRVGPYSFLPSLFPFPFPSLFPSPFPWLATVLVESCRRHHLGDARLNGNEPGLLIDQHPAVSNERAILQLPQFLSPALESVGPGWFVEFSFGTKLTLGAREGTYY